MSTRTRAIRKLGGARKTVRQRRRESGRCPRCGLGVSVGVHLVEEGGAHSHLERFTCGHRVVFDHGKAVPATPDRRTFAAQR